MCFNFMTRISKIIMIYCILDMTSFKNDIMCCRKHSFCVRPYNMRIIVNDELPLESLYANANEFK